MCGNQVRLNKALSPLFVLCGQQGCLGPHLGSFYRVLCISSWQSSDVQNLRLVKYGADIMSFAPTFGSVGDFIAISILIKDTILALDDANGSVFE